MAHPDFALLSRLATSPVRAILLVVIMPFAILAVLLGAFWIGIAHESHGVVPAPPLAYGLFIAGVAATLITGFTRRNSSKFVRVLRDRGHLVDEVCVVAARPIPQIHLLSARQPLAIMLVNYPKRIPEMLEVIGRHTPNAVVVNAAGARNQIPPARVVG